MSAFKDIVEAEKAGFEFVHMPHENMFVALKDNERVAYAHYTIKSQELIDFDSTVVDPAFRGLGIAAVLVDFALNDEIVSGKQIAASCWYVAKHLEAIND